MKRLAIAVIGLALVTATRSPSTGAGQSPPPPATIFQACSVAYPGSVAVTFAWPPTPGALQQWVDLSLFDNGFQPGTFLGAPVEIGMETAYWDGIAPELPHFYRVNVLYPDGWVTVASGSFVSIGGCPKPTAIIYGALVECSGGDFFDTTFEWSPGGGDSQWLDFAWSAEEMALGTYQGYGPLSPDAESYKLRIPTNTPFWWRVNTHSAAGWSPTGVWYFGKLSCPLQAPPAAPPTPVPPAPTPIPPPVPTPPQTGLTATQQQAIFDQWNACDNAWTTGNSLESEIDLQESLGLDTSYSKRQFESVQTYVSSYCVGIGVRLASLPGARETNCFTMLGYGSTVSSMIALHRSLGISTYFLDFAKREIDGFLAAARC
jgi:hypothetical protein